MLKRVTFTGIDRWTKVEELKALYREYPFVKFAMLFSENPDVSNRFPSVEMLETYQEAALPLSAHLCGRLARYPVKTGDWSPVEAKTGPFFSPLSPHPAQYEQSRALL